MTTTPEASRQSVALAEETAVSDVATTGMMLVAVDAAILMMMKLKNHIESVRVVRYSIRGFNILQQMKLKLSGPSSTTIAQPATMPV